MLTVKINSYDESADTFACTYTDSRNGFTDPVLIPATFMPYIAEQTCNECADLPFDLVGKSFTLSGSLDAMGD